MGAASLPFVASKSSCLWCWFSIINHNRFAFCCLFSWLGERLAGGKKMQKLIREQACITFQMKQQNTGKAWKCCRLWHLTVCLEKRKYGWGVYSLQLEAKSGSIAMSVSKVSHDKASERNILYVSYQEVKQYQCVDVNTNQILINQTLVFLPRQLTQVF